MLTIWHVGGDGVMVGCMQAGASWFCGMEVMVGSIGAVVVISEGAKGTLFILIDDFDDNALLLLILDGRLSCHLCFAASRCLCCHTKYSPEEVVLRTPWLRLQFLKQYPLLCQRGQQRLEDPFMNGGGSSVQMAQGKIAL